LRYASDVLDAVVELELEPEFDVLADGSVAAAAFDSPASFFPLAAALPSPFAALAPFDPPRKSVTYQPEPFN
jgi:hypothetical protein